MLLFVGSLHAQYRTTTYCNPLNLDYTYPFHNSHLGKSYRSGADPAVVEFRGEYYMFVTRSWGYWHSKDLLNWDFITPEKWYFEGCNAPAAHNYKGNIKAFESTAKKYGIDFALKKDATESPPRYLVFFKGRDADVLTAAFKEFSAKKLTQEKKPSIRKLLSTLKEAAQGKNAERAKVKNKDREVSL